MWARHIYLYAVLVEVSVLDIQGFSRPLLFLGTLLNLF
jgi:hypothetical protein